MRRVLIVSPNWPPLSCADMHRVRMSLPFMREFGWEPLVMHVNAEDQPGLRDPQLAHTVPADVRVWQANNVPRWSTSWFGVRNAHLRSAGHLARLGRRLIREEEVDLVFISTTMFPLFALGRYWQSREGTPYVLDFQDPWLSDYAGAGQSEMQTLKNRISQVVARVAEPWCVRGASGIIAVSPAYTSKLLSRYSFLRPDQCEVLPFGAAEGDLEVLAQVQPENPYFDPTDGREHWVYVGRGGEDMGFAIRSLLLALQRTRAEQPDRVENLRLHFIGTAYAAGNLRKTFEPLADDFGVADLVEERTERIPYLEALRCLRDADALIVPGSDDPGYTASKIYPYIMAQKPLLAIFHEQSTVVDVLRTTRSGTVVTFGSDDRPERVANQIQREWLGSPRVPAPLTDWQRFERYTAREMTRRQCAFFDRVVSKSESQ